MSRLIQAGALRQYRHNNSDEFVAGYDMGVTDKVVGELEAENENWRKHGTSLNEVKAQAIEEALHFIEPGMISSHGRKTMEDYAQKLRGEK